MDNSQRISDALRENNLSKGESSFSEEEIQRQAEDLERHSLYLNETSRLHLVHALRQGRIGAEEFKRRALNNDPHGQSRCQSSARIGCRFY